MSAIQPCTFSLCFSHSLVLFYLSLSFSFLLRLNDLKVVYIICAAFLGTIVLVNLIVGFATTGKDEKERSSRSSCCFCCFKSTITGCVVKTVFAVNYILFYAIFALTVLLTVALFICYIMSRLCNDGRYVTVNRVDSTYMGRADYADDLQQIDLRQLSPLLKLRANETDLLLFKEHRLKSLCVDYMSGLLTYVLLSALGFFLMLIGFVNYLINIGVNWARKNAKQKYAELFYINGAEMTTFGGDTDPQDDLAAHRY